VNDSMRLFLVTMLLALPTAEPNEAEKLFLDMDKKITGAKTLSYALEIKLESGDKKMSGKGSVILGEGNRGRTEWKVTLDGKSMVMAVVSDGIKMESDTDGKTQKLETPKAFGELNRAAASRSNGT
jgi:outer membrane lipoprotein-sorting protein